jgi:hypothetical protein
MVGAKLDSRLRSNNGMRGIAPDILQTASFAGQSLMAIRDDDLGYFDLHYLGFKTKGFKSMEAAKAAAPAFAREVLLRMSELIGGVTDVMGNIPQESK